MEVVNSALVLHGRPSASSVERWLGTTVWTKREPVSGHTMHIGLLSGDD
jgi:hypothetical protein